MARRRVTAEVDIDADGAKAGAQQTEKSAGRISGAFDGIKSKAGGWRDALGGVGSKASELAGDHLGPLGDAASAVGVDMGKLGAGLPVVGAAVAGVTAFVASGVEKFTALAGEVKQYTSAAGLAAEEASRLNAVMKQFGVEAEDGADVMKTLAEEAALAPDKFVRYGVELAKAADGTVDMAATLSNVADRFKAMSDPTERAAMGAELFGDSWVKIAPILERGGAGLDKLLAGVKDSAIVTDQGIARADAYQQQMRKLGEEFDTLQREVAEEALPAIVAGLEDLAGALSVVNAAADKTKVLEMAFHAWSAASQPFERLVGMSDEVRNAFEGMTTAAGDARPKIVDLAAAAIEAGDAQRTEADAAAKLAEEQAEANREAAEAAERQRDLTRALDDATSAYERAQGAVVTAFEAGIAYDRQTQAVGESLARLSEASQAATDRTNELGTEAAETQQAQADYAAAVEDAKTKVLDQAGAAKTLAERQAEVAGQSLSAAEGNRVYAEKLAEARDATDDPVLRAALDELITKYSGVAGQAWNAASAMRDAAVAAGELNTTSSGALVGSADTMERRMARAAGGPAIAGQSYLVGEHGPEILTMGATGFVTPPSRMGGGGNPAAGPLVVQVLVDGRQMAEAAIPHFEQERRSRM